MTVGENIKAVRVEKELTQKQLAEKCGMATGTIQQYELNKREPRQEQLQKIADALDVPQTRLIPAQCTNEERSKLSEVQAVILNRIDYLTADWDSALKKADYIKAHDDQILISELNMVLKLLG